MNIFLIDKKKVVELLKKNNFKFIISFIILFFSFIIYLSLPSFFNYKNFDQKIQNKVLKDFKFNIKNIKGIQYTFFPQPHFIIEESSIYFLDNGKKRLADVKNLKIYVLLKNLHSLDKIELKKIQFNKVNFNIQLIDVKSFYKHLQESITKPIEIINSNFFYQNSQKEILSISNSKKFNYFIDEKKKQKKINIIGNIFGTNYKFTWNKNYFDPGKSISVLNFQNPNIDIINNFEKNYEKNKTKVFTKIDFLNSKAELSYVFNKDKVIFLDVEDRGNIQKKIRLLGDIELNPFFFNLDLHLNNVKFKNIKNNFFINIHRLNKSVHKNLNGNLKIYFNNLKSKLFENITMNISSLEEKIIFKNTIIKVKNIGTLNFKNINTSEKDDKLYLTAKVQFKIENEKEFYDRFQVSKKNRIKLNNLYMYFENNLDDNIYYVSSFNLKDKKDIERDFHEVGNYQQLTLLIRKEFEKLRKD